jgi:lambda family phage tail tape measure protein
MAQTAEDSLRANAETIRDTQRSFAYGWKEAFESYEDEATNAAKAAERIFEKTTKGMEDMIVDFAKTGKFEFKSLINTILEELLRSQIQQIIAQTFGAFGSTGSRGSGGSNFFSDLFAGFFANGGMIPAGTFGVVGERGPELVTGPAQVTPLTGSNVTYNISAVDAMSFKQMVARDPGFIHAVAQQGGRAVPTRR